MQEKIRELGTKYNFKQPTLTPKTPKIKDEDIQELMLKYPPPRKDIVVKHTDVAEVNYDKKPGLLKPTFLGVANVDNEVAPEPIIVDQQTAENEEPSLS